MKRHRLVMLLFISSEAVFFGSLIITYFVHRNGPGAEARALFDVPQIALFSMALFSSSATIWQADKRCERGDREGVRFWLFATATLGVIFLLGQATEYRALLAANYDLSAGIFTSSFFTLTGFHGLHVLGGLVAISILWLVARSRRFVERGATALESVSLYWHFVDVVWVAIFSIVYLWTRFES